MYPTSEICREIARKSLHLTSIWVPLSLLFVPLNVMQLVFLMLALLLVIFDLIRISSNNVGEKVRQVLRLLKLNYIFREHEKHRLSGATYMLISASAASYLFDRDILILSFMILIVADTAAAVIGKAIGRHYIYDKTLEGSIAFMCCSIIVISIFCVFVLEKNKCFTALAITASIFTTIIELYSKKIGMDDNLTIPFGFALTLLGLNYVIGCN